MFLKSATCVAWGNGMNTAPSLSKATFQRVIIYDTYFQSQNFYISCMNQNLKREKKQKNPTYKQVCCLESLQTFLTFDKKPKLQLRFSRMLLRFAFEHLTAYQGSINGVRTKLCTLFSFPTKLDAILENSILKKSPTKGQRD